MLGSGLVRYPELWTLPRFTDETDNMLMAVAIYQGKIAPLAAASVYISAMFDWAIAALFWLFGLSAYLPRGLVFVVGSLSVAATYVLGRAFGGRLAGGVAAALLATNLPHVAINSHVAWSNCTSPLFTTLAFLALYTGVKRWHSPAADQASPWPVAAAGLLLGLALQTHPSIVLLVVGCGLYLLISAPGLVRTRWPWLGVLLFLVGYSPMIVFNLQTGFASLEDASDTQQLYVRREQTSPKVYLARLGDELATFPAMVGSGPVDAEDRVVQDPREPRLLLGAALALLALVHSAWRRNLLPLIATATYLLTLPLLNDRYERLVDTRYLAPLLPLCFAALGVVVAEVWRRPGANRALLVAISAAILCLPLLTLANYYRVARSTGGPTWDALHAVQRSIQPGERVIVDSDLAEAVKTGDGRLERILRSLLATSGVPHLVADVSREWLAEQVPLGQSGLLIAEPGKLARLGDEFRVDELTRASRVSSAVNFDFATVRVTTERTVEVTPGEARADPDRLARERAEKARTNASERARSRIPE